MGPVEDALRDRRRGFRRLGVFWAATGTLAVATVATLAVLGPPPHPVRAAEASRPEPAGPTRVATASFSRHHQPAGPKVVTIAGTPRQPPAPVPGTALASPDPALLVAADDFPGRTLPRVGADGRRPRAVYAARVPTVLPGQARLALVVDGIGLNDGQSATAIAELPPPVALAVSPYADGLAPVAADARAHGHELLVSLPMEPAGSPDNDEGDRELSIGNAPAENVRNLEWVLSSVTGYAGVTGVDVSGTGEHFTPDVASFRRVVALELAARGLYYLAPPEQPLLPSALPVVQSDLALGPGPLPDRLDAALAALAVTALRDGAAVGVIGPPLGPTEDHLLAFLRTLPARGIILVPPSALAAPLSTPSISAASSPVAALTSARVIDATVGAGPPVGPAPLAPAAPGGSAEAAVPARDAATP